MRDLTKSTKAYHTVFVVLIFCLNGNPKSHVVAVAELNTSKLLEWAPELNAFVFKAATSKAGEHLGLAPLGTLTAGAPADIIAVRGNPFQRFKILEYPDLVMSGGHIVVNKFQRKAVGN